MNLEIKQFSKSDIAEKKKIYYDFQNNVEMYFKGQPEKSNVLAQLLFVTRTFNTYYRATLTSDEQLLDLTCDGLELLWDYIEGRCDAEEFEHFSKGIEALVLYVNTGDQSEIEKNNEFGEKYKVAKQYKVKTHLLLDGIASLIGSLSEKESNEMTWYTIADAVLPELEDIVQEVFGDNGSIESYDYSEACVLPIFENIIDDLVEDIEKALSTNVNEIEAIRALRKEYKNKVLFNDQQRSKIEKYFTKEL